jgi:predicted component of type VI protein secretion system
MKPLWGADVKKYLFANANDFMLNNLRDEIETKIFNNEKRFDYLNVNLGINPLLPYELNVSITYRLKFSDDLMNMNFSINFLK